ncbi:MAG: hypothetical protein HC829_05875 [Bacteroidales bacterium]|nr:hypothetical protein [Bacteroidales bacterium]
MLALLALLTIAGQAPAHADEPSLVAPTGTYQFPFSNPYAATVVGTPDSEQVILPREVPI